MKGAIFLFARFALDIDGLGESLIAQLVSTELVRDVADLYALRAEKLETLEREWAKKSADNVIVSLEASKARTFDRLLTGLGIDHVGQVAAAAGCKCRLAENLLALPPPDLAARLGGISGFGPKLSESVLPTVRTRSAGGCSSACASSGVSRPQPRFEAANSGRLSLLVLRDRGCRAGVKTSTPTFERPAATSTTR